MPTKDHLRVALYARVSSEQQAQQNTIASQVEALERRVRDDGLGCDPELRFIDDGFSGTLLVRPALERLRDQAAAGAIDRLYVQAPDRLSRKYAYQVLLVEELGRCGVEVVFLTNPIGRDPEENLLLQVQGMIAEYERAKIMERSRRGKQHAARHGSVNVLSAAPYGYRYIRKQDGGGEARYQVVAEEARVARKIFEWVGRDHCSMGEVSRRLKEEGVPTRTGRSVWDRATICAILKNPAYKGTTPPTTLPVPASGPSGAAGVPPVQVPGVAASLPKFAVLTPYCPSAGHGSRPFSAMNPVNRFSTSARFLTVVLTLARSFRVSGRKETMTIDAMARKMDMVIRLKPARQPEAGLFRRMFHDDGH